MMQLAQMPSGHRRLWRYASLDVNASTGRTPQLKAAGARGRHHAVVAPCAYRHAIFTHNCNY
eukprot:scaffold869_cov105-Isochrysis_galbana.AAC.43